MSVIADAPNTFIMNNVSKSNIPETLEANEFAGKLVNTGVQIAPDGIELSEILANVGILLKAPDAAKGLDQYMAEQGRATIADQEERKAAFANQLTALNDRSAYNFSHLLHGVQCLIAEIAQKTANNIAKGINEKGMPSVALDGNGVTGDMLLELVN